jgi:superoxide dismutase
MAQSLPHNGWAMLAADGKDLSIVTLPDHETETELNRLLLVNMWDYAYRYDYADAQSYLCNNGESSNVMSWNNGLLTIDVLI